MRQWSSARYMIFWAAPGHLIGVLAKVKQLKIPHEFYAGDYESDPDFRARFQHWVAELWAQKDHRIAQLRAQAQAA